jgi:hypothetical protein
LGWRRADLLRKGSGRLKGIRDPGGRHQGWKRALEIEER